MKTATLQLTRTHARVAHCSRASRDEIINSLRSAPRASLREEQLFLNNGIEYRKATSPIEKNR